MLRRSEELPRRRDLQDLTVVQDDLAGDPAREAHLVADAHHGHPLVGQCHYRVQHFVDRFRLKSRPAKCAAFERSKLPASGGATTTSYAAAGSQIGSHQRLALPMLR